ncbi:molybdopterin-guanine dinucleotide biosynthesis protein B, partial [Intestinibacter sp.]|uniref:molybdopterin-guanine dinucleotide biosynthesis protein B n=1 Tax=Intestinibacter sp. TaxID=1965304 RepID=UPI003F139018
GFKNSDYPKIEIVRKGNSTETVCKEDTLIAIATDIEGLEGKNVIDLNDIDLILKNILDYIDNCDKK